MFLADETIILNRCAGVIAGAPVLGTLDKPRMGEGSPNVQIVVRWRGVGMGSQVANAVDYQHRWEVTVLIAGARVLGAERDAAINGFGQLVSRLLNFKLGHGRRLAIAGDIPAPDWIPGDDASGLVPLSAYFTTPAVFTAAP